MATTHKVVKGDTLWAIAKKYLGKGSRYPELAKLNNIPNPDLIYVGQVIKIDGTASSSSSSSSSTSVTIRSFGLQSVSTSGRTLFVIWNCVNESKTKSYLPLWEYKSNGVWIVGKDSEVSTNENYTVSTRYDTYEIPENATQVRLKIKVIPKTYTKTQKSGKTTKEVEYKYFTPYWTSSRTYNVNDLPPSAPGAPSVDIEDYKLTAKLENIYHEDLNATHIQFEVVKNNTTRYKLSESLKINTNYDHVSYSITVPAGAEYKVRCRAIRDDLESDWSPLSSAVQSKPAASKGITTIKAKSETSVYLEWSAVDNADSYDIEYATKKEYFDITDQTTTKTDIETNKYEITGLESGLQYFFRVRAKNSKGESAWSENKSVIIGKVPVAPTTWSSTTTVITGEQLTLYWVHNAEDGSSQTFADLELFVDGVQELVPPIENSTDEDEKDKTSSYVIDTSGYVEGTVIQWRVRTAGITEQFGDWSVQRTVDVYAPPTLELNVTDINSNIIENLTSFPFYVSASSGPNTQTPIGYHVSIKSNDIYETVDSKGESIMVNQGEEVYSKYFDIDTELLVEFSAGNVDLENNVSYTVVCTVSMNSGLTAEATSSFTVNWTDVSYEPNAEVGIDTNIYSASIRPYCLDHTSKWFLVTQESGVYSTSTTEVDPTTIVGVYTETDEEVLIGKLNGTDVYYCTVYTDVNGNSITPVTYRVNKSSNVYTITTEALDITQIQAIKTITGDEVTLGKTTEGVEIYYSMVDVTTLVDDVLLSVYRREFDGSFTEIASGIENTTNTFVTDPHPALDLARYRIVATTKSTGAVSYYDLPGTPVGGIAIIIQWDEDWSNFESTSDDALVNPPWSGSMLKLPYNVDVSENHSSKVTLVEYVGRKRPVSYYGTQLGETATWNTVIEKDDKETLYALRRLAIWQGDVYVREPSGCGYRANISVSFSQKHRDMTIPVSLSIKRVEGGI